MIARIWRVVTLSINAERYFEYLDQFIIPAIRTAEGNEGLFVLRERQGELSYVMLLSFWASDQALASFAGCDYEVVKLSREAKGLLTAFESTARHYTVVYASKP
ncbi:MAG TPA: hypothetical protein VFZ43_01700 [Anaerolineales bacterium]